MVSIQMSPSRLQKLLKAISLTKTSKPFLSPILFNVTGDGVKVLQVDDAESVFVYAKLEKSAFTSISGEGELVFDVQQILKVLKDLFNVYSIVTISDEGEYLKIVSGDESSKVKILQPSSSSVKTLELEMEKTDWGYKPKSMKVVAGYFVPANMLKTIKAERVKFTYGEKLEIEASETTMSHAKTLPFTQSFHEAEGSVIVDYDIVERIMKNYGSDPIWIVFTEAGPVMFVKKDEDVTILHMVVPQVE